MRFAGFVVAASTVLSFFAAQPAEAQYTNGSQAFGSDKNGRPTDAAGFFEGNVTVFGLPNEQNKYGVFPKVGVQLDGSVFRAQGTAGPCEGSVSLLNGSAYAVASVQVDTTGPSKGSTYRGNDRHRNGKTGTGGGRGPGGLIQCKAGVEVNAISLQGKCESELLGSIAGSVKGVGAQAECGCTGCFAEAYWAKAGAEYTTPKIGGCGVKVSATVGVEVMAGVALGAEAKGTVGGRVKVGPLGVTAAFNVEEFDPGALADCIVNAAVAVKDAAVAVATKAYEVGKDVVNFIGDTASSIGSGIASGAEKVGCFFSGLFGGGCKDEAPKGTTTPRGTTVAGGPYTPGIGVGLNVYTAATAATVFQGLSTGQLPGVQGTGSSGTAAGSGTAGALGR